MIAQVTGTLVAKQLDRVTIATAGGIGYELVIPLGVYETLPKTGEQVHLHTYLVVRDTEWMLFGFTSVFERQVFQRLLTANGVGPSLAIGLLSHLTAERLVRALTEKDLAALQGVPRVGRKKAERLILDLADKINDLHGDDGAPRPEGAKSEDAIRALISTELFGGGRRACRCRCRTRRKRPRPSSSELIRHALAQVAER